MVVRVNVMRVMIVFPLEVGRRPLIYPTWRALLSVMHATGAIREQVLAYPKPYNRSKAYMEFNIPEPMAT